MGSVQDVDFRGRPTELKHSVGRIKRASGTGEFEAVIATLGVIDSDGDIIAPGAFNNATVSIVPAHDHGSVPLGKAKMQDRGNEAVAVGKFNLDIQSGKEWHSALKLDFDSGDPIQEWSFGFRVLDSEEEMRDGEPVRILKRLDVMEISPVLRGAGVDTRTLAVKNRRLDDSINYAVSTGLCRLAKMDYDDSTALHYYKVVETPGFVMDLTLEFAGMLGIRSPLPLLIEPSDSKDFDIEQRFGINGLHSPELPKSVRKHAKAGGVSSTIYVRSRSLAKMLGTIAHETRHAWQLAKGYYRKGDQDECERDACAFQTAALKAFNLPDYADLLIGRGDAPLNCGSSGSAFGLFHYDYESGVVSRAIGDMPWPRWNTHSTVDLSAWA